MAVAAETAELGTRENFAALLDESLGVATGTSGLEGTVVKGHVIAIENDFALIDVGLKSEGRVPLKEFAVGGAAPEIHVGDTDGRLTLLRLVGRVFVTAGAGQS